MDISEHKNYLIQKLQSAPENKFFIFKNAFLILEAVNRNIYPTFCIYQQGKHNLLQMLRGICAIEQTKETRLNRNKNLFSKEEYLRKWKEIFGKRELYRGCY